MLVLQIYADAMPLSTMASFTLTAVLVKICRLPCTAKPIYHQKFWIAILGQDQVARYNQIKNKLLFIFQVHRGRPQAHLAHQACTPAQTHLRDITVAPLK